MNTVPREHRLQCRPARREDVSSLLAMIRELAAHEGDADQVFTDIAAMTEAGFGAAPRFGAVLAEADGRMAGFVSYTWHYSIWRASTAMHIDDVYVREEFRGRGVGARMMNFARQLALGAGAAHVRWEVKPHNAAAIAFYERLGATMRLKGVFTWRNDM